MVEQSITLFCNQNEAMPNTLSAKKRLRQNVVRRKRNRSIKSEIGTTLRKVREQLAAGEIEKCEQTFQSAAKKIDRAAAGRIIHPNRAARVKSRVQKRIRLAKQTGGA